MGKRTGEEIASEYPGLVVEGGKEYNQAGMILNLISMIVIFGMFIPILIVDISARIYQFVYFGIHDIPKIKRKPYVVIDRGHLSKLSFAQKVSCTYCGYANGTVNWLHALAAQTEIYSCAVKHWHPAKGQDHQKNFFSYRTFE